MIGGVAVIIHLNELDWAQKKPKMQYSNEVLTNLKDLEIFPVCLLHNM
jgi:hypothetical protein